MPLFSCPGLGTRREVSRKCRRSSSQSSGVFHLRRPPKISSSVLYRAECNPPGLGHITDTLKLASKLNCFPPSARPVAHCARVHLSPPSCRMKPNLSNPENITFRAEVTHLTQRWGRLSVGYLAFLYPIHSEGRHVYQSRTRARSAERLLKSRLHRACM